MAGRTHHTPAPTDDTYAGVLIWYNTEKVEVSEVETLVPGRIQRAKVRVLADGTEMTMLNVYIPARSGSPKTAELRRLEETRTQMAKAAEEADERQEVLVVAGDLQAQTQVVVWVKGAVVVTWWRCTCRENIFLLQALG